MENLIFYKSLNSTYLIFLDQHRKLISVDFETPDKTTPSLFKQLSEIEEKIKSYHFIDFDTIYLLSVNGKIYLNNELLFPETLKNQKIKKLFIFYKSFYCLTEADELFVWGNNYDGQLGVGNLSEKYIIRPQLLQLPNDEKVENIISDGATVFFLTQRRNLFSCGYNGQIFSSDKRNSGSPNQIILDNIKKIKNVYIFSDMFMIIDEENKGYITGIYLKVLEISLPNDQKIKDVFHAASEKLFILTDLDNIYLVKSSNYHLYLLLLLPKNEKVKNSGSFSNSKDFVYFITTKQSLLLWGSIHKNYYNNGVRRSELKLSISNAIYLILPNNSTCVDILRCHDFTICYTSNKELYLWKNNILWRNKIFEDEDIQYLIIDEKDLIPFSQNTSKNLPFFLLDPNWNVKNHRYTHSENKLIIKTFLILSLENKKRTLDNNYKPKYPESLLFLLPRDIILEIFQYLHL
jgi:hypothetical protein